MTKPRNGGVPEGQKEDAARDRAQQAYLYTGNNNKFKTRAKLRAHQRQL